jgi:uncharacterized membrane protein
MTTNRIEAFSDGVFAIAITLLVLEFRLPGQSGHLWHYLWSLWPSFLAYGISFLLIGLVWANHHSMFIHIKHADRTLMFLNMLLLANVAFLPFPTELLAHALREASDLKVATFFYGLTLTTGGIFFNAIWQYATNKRRLVHEKVTDKFIRTSRIGFILGPISYAIATVLSLVWPGVAIALYIFLILYYWLPPRGEHEVLTNA